MKTKSSRDARSARQCLCMSAGNYLHPAKDGFAPASLFIQWKVDGRMLDLSIRYLMH